MACDNCVSKNVEVEKNCNEEGLLTSYGLIYKGVNLILQGIEGVDSVKREGLRGTPDRVARMYTQELCSGYSVDAEKLLSVTFSEDFVYDELIAASFPFYSLCEHHMLPFFGTAYVGYLPDKKVTGLSKLGRVVDAFAKRLQIQERLSSQIASAIYEYLNPLGCGVIIEAQHLCAEMRGVNKVGAKYITSSLKGNFFEPSVKQEFISFVDRLKMSK